MTRRILAALTVLVLALCATTSAGAGVLVNGPNTHPSCGGPIIVGIWAPGSVRPTGLVATGHTATSVSLDWASSPCSSRDYYTAYTYAADGTTLLKAERENRSAGTVSGLSAGTTYVFRVTVSYHGKESPKAAPVTSTTDDAPPPPPPPPDGMPVGDLPGFHQIFTDDFTQDVPLGQWPAAVASKWKSYDCGWPGTPSWGTYCSEKTTTQHDGVMDIYLHDENGQHLIAANEPKINPASQTGRDILYGRVAYRMKVMSPGSSSYHLSNLFWPISEVWPRDGEIDFPEGNFAGTACAFTHYQDGTSGGDQDAICPPSAPTWNMADDSWHTIAIDWTPGALTYWLDGQVFGQTTTRIPNTRMRYVLQNSAAGTSNPATTTPQRIQYDWFVAYRYTP